MPTTAKTIPQIQNVLTTRHSHQPSNSKSWCNGLILQTRLPVVLKEITWIITDNVSKTHTPPIITSSISIFVIIAIPAIAAPSDKEPVSPINSLAGWVLKTKNPSSAPTVANANIVTNSYSGK